MSTLSSIVTLITFQNWYIIYVRRVRVWWLMEIQTS